MENDEKDDSSQEAIVDNVPLHDVRSSTVPTNEYPDRQERNRLLGNANDSSLGLGQEGKSRGIHTARDIDKIYAPEPPPSPSFRQRLCDGVSCTKQSVGNFFLKVFPIINVVKTYKREYLVGDFLGGISSASLHFPQGLAFGILASLTPAVGLYTGFFPVAFYMIFGTCQHLSFGTNAVVAIIIAEVTEYHGVEISQSNISFPEGNSSIGFPTDDMSDNEEVLAAKIATSSGSSLLVGIILGLMSFLRLGFITSYMSASFVHAFVCACAIHIGSSQVARAIGVSVPHVFGVGKLIKFYTSIFKNITEVNVASVIVTVITMVILILVKDCINEKYKDKIKFPIPIDLIIIILATIISHIARFHDNFGISVVGDIPRGLPSPQLPRLTPEIIADSFIIALLTFVLNISLVRTFEDRHNYQLDDNRELLAYGLSNVASSFFHCFPPSAAPPRSMILSSLGAKTTLNGVFTMAFMLLILLVVGPLFSAVPHPVLSAMVMVAVKNLVLHVLDIPKFWRNNRYDGVIWVATFIGGVFLDIPYGLYIGVLVGFLTVIVQSQTSSSYFLGKLKDSDLFLQVNEDSGVSGIKGIKVFRMESSLYFATAVLFRDALFKAIGDPQKNKSEFVIEVKDKANDMDEHVQGFSGAPRYIILDMSPVNYMDVNGMKMLAQISNIYKSHDVTVVLAGCSKYVKEKLLSPLMASAFPDTHVFTNLNIAVRACQIDLPKHEID